MKKVRDQVGLLHVPFLGALIVSLGMVAYPAVTRLGLTHGVGDEGVGLAYAYLTLALVISGLCILFSGATAVLINWPIRRQFGNSSPASVIAEIYSKKRYLRLLLLSAIVYGVFFSLGSGIIVFQPALNFSRIYHLGIPSVAIATCCGSVGQTPEAAVYLTQHVGLLLIPINLLLLFAISWLVGLNTSLAFFALKFRTKNVRLGWFGGLGASVGLFASCPTCAGLAMLSVLGAGGVFSTVFLSGTLQTLSVALSLPMLVVSAIATTKTLNRLMSRGCLQATYNG